MGGAQRENGHDERCISAQLTVRSGDTAVVHALGHLLLLGGSQWCGQSAGVERGVYQFIGLIFSIYCLFAKSSALRVNMLTCDELSCRRGGGVATSI